MVQTKLSKFTANVGEDIGLQLGAQMISSYNVANPADTASYYVGRNIIEQILAQPGCVGIKFYNAYNEVGEKVFVYVGVNTQGNDMLELVTIDTEGKLDAQKGIVADRGIRTGITTEDENWWDI